MTLAATALAASAGAAATPAAPTVVVGWRGPTTYGALGFELVTVSGANGPASGYVSLSLDGALVGRVALNGNGNGEATALPNPAPHAGTHALQADYEGDATYAPKSATGSVVISKADAFASVSSGADGGGVRAFQAFDVSGGVGSNPNGGSPYATNPTGRLRLLFDGVEVARKEAGSSGGVFWHDAGSPGGSHTESVYFDGDADHSPASDSKSFTIARYDTTTSITSGVGGSPGSCPPGSGPASTCAPTTRSDQPVTLIATVARADASACCSSGVPISGIVRFFEGGFERGSAPVSGAKATLTLDGETVGTHFYSARYDGDGTFNGSTSGAMPYEVRKAKSGYWMVGAGGDVYGFGDAAALGSAPVGGRVAVDIEPTPSGDGYWVVDDLGHIFTFGTARNFGGVPGLAPFETVTSMSSTPSGGGYWLFTNLGRVVNYGDASHLGDMSGRRLNGPVLDSIATPTGRGYYMVASDGGVFTFGDAHFSGSMGDVRLNAPVQSLVPDVDGDGYWLVASDGGIFAFDAGFFGSMGATRLNRPVTGMVRSATGGGYLMVGEDGGIFTFGDATFEGSLGDRPPARPVTSVAVIAP